MQERVLLLPTGLSGYWGKSSTDSFQDTKLSVGIPAVFSGYMGKCSTSRSFRVLGCFTCRALRIPG